ncbi:5-formyltetrahydrofolate cyclo-ligase [Trinorchestia longiramus]|nr:5-formyltetrahydrofolate cyclo-ligase [Trinorchestia longiramus]
MFSSDSIQIEDSEGLTKLDIRQKVWKHFQDNDLANFPLSVFRRIPNFKGADEAGAKLAELDCFKMAKSVKVNLDKPQGEVRFLTLQAGKVLLVPTPGLRTGLFNRMDSTSAGSDTTENLRLLAQNDGMKRHSTSLDLDADAKVDLVVVGSVAVSRTGHRIGKGEGFVDLEYGMMRHMNCVNEYTLIVTTVHDCQVFDSLPERLFAVHDVPVDLIVTPTQVLPVSKRASRPAGILWDLIDADKFYRVAILRTLWQRLESAGQTPRIKGEEPVPSEEQIAEYWKKVEATREANREARAASRRGGGRGRRGFRRGRGGGRRYEGDEDGPVDEDGNRLQVTVSVNKRNRIVRRSVRSANQLDREGDASLNDGRTNGEGEDMPARGRGRSRYNRRGRAYYGQPPFSVFLGNVPPHSRTREIKEAVKEVIEDKARGVDIQRRTYAGFAFLRFSRIDADHADEVVSALQGLKILDQEVVVEKARTKSSRSEGEQNGEAGYGNEEGSGGGGGYRGSRGGRRGGKRYRGARRGRGFGGRDDRRRKRDDEEGGSGYEDDGREYREPNQGPDVAPAGDAGEEASSNWEK